MAGMDGMTALAELRTLWPKWPTRVLVITAHGSINTAIEAMRLGASAYLEKPFAPDQLRRSVSNVLQDRPLHAGVKKDKDVGRLSDTSGSMPRRGMWRHDCRP
jgi:DNA-binding NtrC family response regulator